VPVSDLELAALTRVYSNHQGDLEYLPFLRDTQVLSYIINDPFSGAKATYKPTDLDFSGSKQFEDLLKKIRDTVKRHRIRLGEFLQDHDPLRKGSVDATKFRTTLYAQKIQLTAQEYALLESIFKCPKDSQKIRYFEFVELVDQIFTEKDLEKCPTKTLTPYLAPSVLDPKTELSGAEASALEQCLSRLGTQIQLRRLLIKPFFQDKDKSNSGFVAVTRFGSIFDNLQLALSEPELLLIAKRFQAQAPNEINYVEFDHYMKRYE
jgi:hypothetical protein